jgi:alpha-galactosidase
MAGHIDHSKRAENMGILSAVQRPLKLVFLGAGSGELGLVDVDPERLELAEKLAGKIIAEMGSTWTIQATADRRTVLKNADYIINCIEVSGTQCVRHDNDIPAKFGVDQCIGDTIGPGGLMKALRTVPVFLDVLKDVEKYCPNAWVLNYTNPMSIMCLAAARASSAKVIGLCHSVQGTSHHLAEYAGVPYEHLVWKCGGINHLAWFTELKRDGVEDIYPILFEKARAGGEVYEKDPIRFDMMLHFGHFVTESSGHFSEYLPYYRKRPELIKKYCRSNYRGQSSFYADGWPQWRKECDENRRQKLAGQKPITFARTWEYASYIIEAMETGSPFTIYGTVPNKGLIENLPSDGVIETACLVDRRGVMPTRFGPLPPQCAALCDWNMRMFDLAATACIEKSRAAATHALMLDPLTAAVCCPAEIKQMAEELFEAEKEFLPGF